MERKSIAILAEALDMYYRNEDFFELAALFDSSVESPQGNWRWLPVARQLIERIEYGNNREFLDSLLEQLEIRNADAIARTSFERRTPHERLEPEIRKLKTAVGDSRVPRELAVAENKPFAAKSEVREFLEKSETPIFVIDPYVGVGTLDCFRAVKQPIRLLSGTRPNSIETGFDGALAAFQSEGFAIEIRREAKLHDRHIVFNDRCWLVGSSLKDAGGKAFHAIEITDAKAEVLAALEAKWTNGAHYP